jgi:hypothetical protein
VSKEKQAVRDVGTGKNSRQHSRQHRIELRTDSRIVPLASPSNLRLCGWGLLLSAAVPCTVPIGF